MGIGSSTSSTSSISVAPQIETQIIPEESLSVVSNDSTDDDDEVSVVNNTTTQVVRGEGDGNGSVDGIFTTLWKPTVSEELLEEELDHLDQGGAFISGSASFSLVPSSHRQKKQRCSCFCCKFRRRKRKTAVQGTTVSGHGGGNDSDDNLDEESPEIFSLQSAEEMMIIPSEIFPLELVATLEMSPSEVRAKPVKKRRTRVPEKPDKPMSLWSLIKNAIGKDLTRYPLPVNFGEPLSMLQRLAEDYEYSQILDKAASLTDSLEQLASVAVFTISSYSSCAIRTAKPFNPLLGETYEFDRTDDMGWRCIGEQVCHHPPIAALHCESAMGWVQWQQFTMKSNFKGTYLEIQPLGVAHIRFKEQENHYTWRKVSTIVRNLYVGKLYIEQDGEMDIINHYTSERCHIKYSSGGMWTRDRSVVGRVYNTMNEPKWEVFGDWSSEVYTAKLDSNGKRIPSETKLIWKLKPAPPDAEKRYNFSVFAAQLNEMEEDVAPTDSRFRPDQRFMENGLWDEANLEKQRLEDKQRDTRKFRIADGARRLSTSSKLNAKSGMSPPVHTASDEGVEPYYTPAWFTRQNDPMSGQYIYIYNGEYWNCKDTEDWKRCPKLFDK